MQGVWLYFFAGHTDGYLSDSRDFLVFLVFKQWPGFHLPVFLVHFGVSHRWIGWWKRQNLNEKSSNLHKGFYTGLRWAYSLWKRINISNIGKWKHICWISCDVANTEPARRQFMLTTPFQCPHMVGSNKVAARTIDMCRAMRGPTHSSVPCMNDT